MINDYKTGCAIQYLSNPNLFGVLIEYRLAHSHQLC
jgi:hypothetical protein